ncbi:DUF1269 domain-containing protein [Rhizobium sp. TH2]|nr:DUF1269 domain-containing protein [Rhizobium sp. TH2]
MKDIAANLDPGKGALFVQILEMTPDRALKALSPHGGVVLKTSLDETKEQVLRDALQKATRQASPRLGGIGAPRSDLTGRLSDGIVVVSRRSVSW